MVMNLRILRDENAEFFQEYWKNWHELAEDRQGLEFGRYQEALHDLMEGYDWDFDGENFTEGAKAVELAYKLYKAVRPHLELYSAEKTLAWLIYYGAVGDEGLVLPDEPIKLDVDIELSSTDVEFYKRCLRISKKDVCYNDFEEFEDSVLVQVAKEVERDLMRRYVRGRVYKSCLYYLSEGSDDDKECVEIYLGEDEPLKELEKELPDIAYFEKRLLGKEQN